MTKFINATPHALTIRVNGTNTVVPPSVHLARVATTQEIYGALGSVPVMRNVWGEVEGMPTIESVREAGAVVLVSALVLGRLGSEWANLAFAPDTGKTAIRNEAGQVVAVTQLVAM